MKKTFFFGIILFKTVFFLAQEKQPAFVPGELLQYKMSYSGFLRAGTATLEVSEQELNGKNVFYAKGKGWTTGMIKWFFEVKDLYESYFDQKETKPYLFKRKINEGGYKKHRITTFNYSSNKAYIQDFLAQNDTTVPFMNVQDILSSFYYLRNKDVSNLQKGEDLKLDMFIDAQVYPFKLRYLGKEVVETKFGKIKTLVFRPFVQSGRVFKAEESVTIWITDDSNKIPIRVKASLVVGSLRAELEAYQGLATPFKL